VPDPEPDRDLGDPLATYRVDVASTADGIRTGARERGETVHDVFTRGGPPVALTDTSLWLADEGGDVYRLTRDDVRGLGQIRSTDYHRMRWGIGLYLGALLAFFLHWILTGLLLVAGGVLVVLGFLAKALLVQVEDDRIPPFVIEHREWKDIREALDHWHQPDRETRA
jgi:hypothetical protein